jgi:hypothetical protein
VSSLKTWLPIPGTAPTASALPALLTALEHLNLEGVLAGLLDSQRVVLGGHSAGVRVAIESANPNFFPQVVAALAYGAQTAAIVQLGYEPGQILPVCDRFVYRCSRTLPISKRRSSRRSIAIVRSVSDRLLGAQVVDWWI